MFKNKHLLAAICVLALTLGTLVPALAADIFVDSFAYTTTTASYTITGSSSFPVVVEAASTTGVTEVLGGQRDLCLIIDNGNLNDSAELRSDADNDYLTQSLSASVAAKGVVQWDGAANSDCTLNPTGLGAVSLIDGTNTGLLVRVIYSDGVQVDITIRLYTNGTNWAEATIPFDSPVANGQTVDLFLPFTAFVNQAGTMDPASIGAVELELDGATNSTGADITVKLIQASSAYEYGDLPAGYGASLLDARHIPAFMRLGYNVDAETAHHASLLADGDNADQSNDEDGVVPYLPGNWTAGSTRSVRVRYTGCSDPDAGGTACFINGWIDWNRNGNFGDSGENILTEVMQIGDGISYLSFSVPAGTSFSNVRYYARFRICPAMDTCNQPGTTQNNVQNGEIEDYAWDWGVPTAVELASFTAEAAGPAIQLAWETASEVDTLGFNLYRATAADGPRARVNAALIEGQLPGSPMGATYSLVDGGVQRGVTYYYWLEDVAADGAATLHGPVTTTLKNYQKSLPSRPRPVPVRLIPLP